MKEEQMNIDSEVEANEADGGRNEQDDLIITYLAEGWTHRQVGEQVGASTKTIQRRLADPGFGAAVAARRRERIGQISGQLISATDGAIAVLRNELNSDDPKLSLRAATLILDNANKFHRVEAEHELARRQDELERRIQETVDALTRVDQEAVR